MYSMHQLIRLYGMLAINVIHKILTGRKDKMLDDTKYKGISGFFKTEESVYDTFGAGHSST